MTSPVDNAKPAALEFFDTEPVNLDPPAPELARWQELADQPIVIPHGGDASKVLNFPRPDWADPDMDYVGSSVGTSAYRSEPVRIAARGCLDSRNVDGVITPAHVNVAAELWGGGTRKIHLDLARFEGKGWSEPMIGLYLDEALQLADALRAAVDLFGGAK
ncbi:hypothetical protein A5761_08670 [Mycolicibacterium setense]|uniref:hypothetical protein n=1 Tax=Mycolicibacterium setense TaxID=431269 RepID=UPI0007E9DB5D|nr:hypothetical protein [Mycolicibacterium setense]OBB18547.1 hypothetical protein A5761_08670 [Mycolicibacterium setense]